MSTLFTKKWGPKSDVELAISFVTDCKIRTLNKKYRRKDKPTDVLSFPLMYEAPSRRPAHALPVPMLGDIVISVDTAGRNAERLGRGFEEELKFLLIHGFLHLVGYDHELSRKEALLMQRKERECLRLLK